MSAKRAVSTIRRWPEPPVWRVERDGWGRLVVLDEEGIPVLRNPDPVRALEHAHLAAAAPRLRAGMAPLIWRLERIAVDHGIDVLGRDELKVAAAWSALLQASPPADELAAAREQQHQQAIPWEDAA